MALATPEQQESLMTASGKVLTLGLWVLFLLTIGMSLVNSLGV